jgi:hypothetical protein
VGGQVYGWVDKKTDKSLRVVLFSYALRDNYGMPEKVEKEESKNFSGLAA